VIPLAATEEYGPLSDVVAAAGSIIAASGAIALAWRGRTKWEPSEQDLDKGPQKVGGLLAAVLISVLWFQTVTGNSQPPLGFLAILLSGLCLVSLFTYSFLISVQTFSKLVSTGPNKSEERKVVGGFRLTERAKEALRKNDVTLQELFAGSAYNEALVWTPSSRALAKIAFAFSYIVLTVSGTVALASVALLISTVG
jgi:hypothetical protein